MICDDCTHVILRTIQNGTQDPVTTRICDLDGATTTYQLKECSRKETRIIPIIEKVQELHELTDPVLPSLPEVAKKRGNPNWVKRGS